MRLILKRMVNLSLKPAVMSIQFHSLQDHRNTAVMVAAAAAVVAAAAAAIGIIRMPIMGVQLVIVPVAYLIPANRE